MRLKLACYWCVSMFLFSPTTRGQDSRVISQTCMGAAMATAVCPHSNLPRAQEQQQHSCQIIQMTAKKYEYSPSQVHVTRGTKVEMKITAIDRDHGFTIATVLKGADPTTPAASRFYVGSRQGQLETKERQGDNDRICGAKSRVVRIQVLRPLRLGSRAHEGSTCCGSLRKVVNRR
jgi:hypothetical protein